MIEHEVGVRTVQTIRIRRLDLQAFEDEDAA
jgi:restriction endonuclease Mrr